MGYPQTADFVGVNQPVAQEVSLKGLPITGTLPPEVRGTFFRAVPDPAFETFLPDDTVLSGDGMISAIRFNDDQTVDFDIRYVNTARHQAEVAAGRALFGRYRNPFTDDASVKDVDRTVANTTPVWHAGKLLMTKEDGRPYRIDPKTLDTLGSYDFGGKLKSETMTAHVRIDPATGEMFFYGYEADGLASNKVAYCIADKHGNLVSEQWFDAPYCAMMHDFTISENYALFPIYPTKADFDRIKAGGDHWAHQMDEDSWLGVMPRYGDVSEMRWFKGPKGVFCYHMMNAHDDGNGVLHFDQCLADCNAFPFIQKASGLNVAPQDMNGRLARWTVDMKSDATEITETVIGPPGDFPIIPAAEQGRAYSRAWMLTMNPDLQGPPLPGGPVGVMFNLLFRMDWPQGVTQALPLPPLACYNEPVHVPSATPGHDGWLVTVVTSQAGEDDYASEVWVIDGGNLGAGPVAKAAIPHRLRPQVHGWWVNAAQLAQAI